MPVRAAAQGQDDETHPPPWHYIKRMKGGAARRLHDIHALHLAGWWSQVASTVLFNILSSTRYGTSSLLNVPPAGDDDDDEAALTYAALAAEHPEPQRLAALATAAFGAEHFDKIAAWLRADRIDTVDDIYNSLIRGRQLDGGGRYLFCLRVCKYPDDDDHHHHDATCHHEHHRCPSVLLLDQDDKLTHNPPCNYIKRKEALLVDHIQALHLTAISRLSPDSVKALHRGLVLAGYLYGPFDDPVFNVLVNAIWFQLNFPPLAGDDDLPEEGSWICTHLMLRTGFNALTGQVAFLRSKYGDTLSGHDAMECLYFSNCDLLAAMEMAEEAGHHAVSGYDFVAATECAVKAMKHPAPQAMTALMACDFTPELEDQLRDLLPAEGDQLSCEGIDKISRLLSSLLLHAMPPPAAAVSTTMHPDAMEEIQEERRAFRRRQRFLMERIQLLLLDTNYEAHTICAVARFHHLQMQYHVNFLAATRDSGDQITSNVLFFAQICFGARRRSIQEYTRSSCQKNKDWLLSFCSPVAISSCLGRCFPCEFRRTKIVHPIGGIDMDYFGRQEETYVNFSDYIASATHSVYNYKMDSDYVYFDPRVNTELAEYLNERAKEKEEMTEEEAYQAFLREMPCGRAG